MKLHLHKLVALSAVVAIIQGCGAYYTKDTYFRAQSSEGWSRAFGDSRFATFSCKAGSIRLLPTTLDTVRTAEAVLGIPVYPSDGKEAQKDESKEYYAVFEYDTKNDVCHEDDVVMNSTNKSFKPYLAQKSNQYKTESRCIYSFPTKAYELSEFKLIFKENLIGCSLPPLNLQIDSGYNYNFSPW